MGSPVGADTLRAAHEPWWRAPRRRRQVSGHDLCSDNRLAAQIEMSVARKGHVPRRLRRSAALPTPFLGSKTRWQEATHAWDDGEDFVLTPSHPEPMLTRSLRARILSTLLNLALGTGLFAGPSVFAQVTNLPPAPSVAPDATPGAANTAPTTPSASLYTSMDALDNTQRLSAGDRVSYRVIEDKEDPKPLIVTDAGELEVPYLGRVKAVDKTCQQLAREIKVALEKDLYFQATVILAVDQLNRKRGTVYLVGQVQKPGTVEIPSDETLTLSKAILRAGGFGEFANRRKVRVSRATPGGDPTAAAAKPIEVDVDDILKNGRADRDLKLEPGDLIFVPSKLINF